MFWVLLFHFQVIFTTNSSPSEDMMTHSVYVGIPNNCSGHRMATRIANSMPPKKWTYTEVCLFIIAKKFLHPNFQSDMHHSRSVR